MADRRSWGGVAPLLARAGHEVITYDRRGFGDAADAAADPAFTHVADLAAVLDGARAERSWLVGSSMGGRLAVDFALAAPERVAGLVLLASVVSGFPDRGSLVRGSTTRTMICKPGRSDFSQIAAVNSLMMRAPVIARLR